MFFLFFAFKYDGNIAIRITSEKNNKGRSPEETHRKVSLGNVCAV